MSISKPESASDTTEREYESEHESEFESEPELEAGRGSEPEWASEREPESELDGEREPRATTLPTAEPVAAMGRDEDASMGRDEEPGEDAMSGEAVQTRPQSTPMRPGSAPEFASGSGFGSAPSSPATPTAQPPLTTDPGPVLAPETSLDFRERWQGIQAEFIDDPRRAVEDADRLIGDVSRAFASSVEERRRGLTSGWENDGRGETEELRLAMRQYRALVDHLLHD